MYANGAQEQRALGVRWHENFGLCNISFYNRCDDELMFAEDFDLETAIELRDRLTRIIETATTNFANFAAQKPEEAVANTEIV
jgi:hypothetical protein